MTEQKKLLLKILDAIDFVGQKEAFADMFANLIFEEAVYALMQTLPEKQREKVAKKWDNNMGNHAALTSLLEHYFTKQQLTEATEKVAHKAMYDYLQSIDRTLSNEQKEKLFKLTEEIKYEDVISTKKDSTYRRMLKN